MALVETMPFKKKEERKCFENEGIIKKKKHLFGINYTI